MNKLEYSNGETTITNLVQHTTLIETAPVETLSLSEDDQIQLAIQNSLHGTGELTQSTSSLTSSEPTTSAETLSTGCHSTSLYNKIGFQQFLGKNKGND